MPIRKILIANRGEIACRIIRTCNTLGIETVAICSAADINALHVERADQIYHIGPAPARDSYLDIDKVIAAAKTSGAEAIHPGYGFLSENAEFAERCEKEGIIFIGPPASAIRAMGGKSEAKALMQKAGVPLVPGYHGDKQDLKTLQKEAEKIGYPVLIKASAGGGGKGMRIVKVADDFEDALASAQREAKAGFGDDKVLIEKYIKNPRHIEFQIFADSLGNCVHFFERDCSVQRRHQKVIEEAPAINISDATRGVMGAAAIAAAQAINYVGAGTVEFLLDADENFYFMEMNTRLQVEHPVTEMVTGVDLVALQILIAGGKELDYEQGRLALRGHAVEVRLYAEDPENNFLPGAGDLRYLSFPDEYEHLRVDTGVRSGDVISIHYDPMIAKIITFAETREEALVHMAVALDETHIAGPKSNLNFLRALVHHPEFIAGNITTKFIDEHHKDLLPVPRPPADEVLVMASLSFLDARIGDVSFAADPWASPFGWRMSGAESDTYHFKDATGIYDVRLSYPEDLFHPVVTLPGGREVKAQLCEHDGDGFTLVIDGTVFEAVVDRAGTEMTIMYDGHDVRLTWLDPLFAGDAGAEADAKLTAPMPGKVVAISVEAGTEVKKGMPLVVVEAMKMEHTITAPFDGVIAAVNAAVGEHVDEKKELVAFQ